MDFIGLNGIVNELAKQFALLAIIVILIGLAIGIGLKVLRIPKTLADPILGLSIIYVAYKVFMVVIA